MPFPAARSAPKTDGTAALKSVGPIANPPELKIFNDDQDVWTEKQIIEKAKKLLELRESQIPIPEEIYTNTWSFLTWGEKQREQIKRNYLARRNFFLEKLADGKLPHYSTDADGTCTFKTVQKVENSRSIGSLVDKHFLRIVVKAFKKLGAYFEINTARTGFIPGPSVVGTEGPKFKNPQSNWVNPRAGNEISGLLHEFGIHTLKDIESLELFETLIINGLSGAVRHDPRNGGSLFIAPPAKKYAEFINFLNTISIDESGKGFLHQLEEIVANKKEANPLKVLEYKSIPQIFFDHPEFKVKDYFNYISLVEECREERVDHAKFLHRLNQSGISLPKDYYDPTNPPSSEKDLTNRIRLGKLVCLTPHAFDSNNIVRRDKKIEIYKTLARFVRSPEAQEWAEKTYGIPRGTSLFTINGKDVSHIDFDNFSGSIGSMVIELKDNGKAPENKEHVLINVAENDQPYCEIAPNSSKADVMPDYKTVTAQNKTVIGAGDSPGTDAVFLAQAIILGGAGFIVRGLMDKTHVANQITEQLAKTENKWHEFALTEIPKGKDPDGKDLPPDYKLNSTGEIKSKKEWSEFFANQYKDRIFYSSNIHENNAFNAAIFSEFFGGEGEFDLTVDEKQHWAQEVINSACKKSLATPISEAAEEALKNEVYEQSIFDKFPLLEKIPFIKNIFDPYQAGATFDKLLYGVSRVLIGAAPIEIVADKLGFNKIAGAASLAQRIAYGINTIASGVSRGLFLSSHKFYWQFIGEIFGLVSTFFGETSTLGRTLRAVNQTVLIGRANELAMRTNYNLDDFKDKDKVKEQYDKDPTAKEYFDKKEKAAELTQNTINHIEKWSGGILGKIPGGKALVGTVAQFIQGIKLANDYVRSPQLRANTLKNILSLGIQGPVKISKNSGKPYGEVHEENTYAFAGMSTLTTALASAVLGKITGNHVIDKVLTNIANMIPAIGIITAGKLVHQDQAGDPRLFTDIAKKQQKYSPERSGFLQMVSGWLMAITGAFQHTKTGAVLYNMANGIYFEGIRELLKVNIDDAAVNKATRGGVYYRNGEHYSPRTMQENLAKVA